MSAIRNSKLLFKLSILEKEIAKIKSNQDKKKIVDKK